MAMIETMQVDLFRLPLPVPVEASAAGLMKGFDMIAVRLHRLRWRFRLRLHRAP